MSNVEGKYPGIRHSLLYNFYIQNWKFDILHYGTGSYPCPPQGWQRLNRFTVSQNPLNTPYFLNASSAYCEQVGVNRHFGPRKGDITH